MCHSIMGFKSRKYRKKGEGEGKLFSDTFNLFNLSALKKQPEEILSKTKCNLKLNGIIKESKPQPRHSCTKCNSSYKYKKNLVLHLKKHLSSPLVKPFEEKENRFCIRTLSICLKKLSEKDILSASKRVLVKKESVEENKNKHMETTTISARNLSDGSVPPDGAKTPTPSPEISFRCSKCQDEFSGELEFEKHFESVHWHSKGKVMKCSDCLEEFEEREDLFWHCRTTHFELRLHKCPDCEVMSLNEKQIVEHISLAHTKPVFECWACDMRFSVEESLIEHFNNQHFL